MTTVTVTPPTQTFPVSLGEEITLKRTNNIGQLIEIKLTLTEDVKKCWKKYGDTHRLTDGSGYYVRSGHVIYHIYKKKGLWTFEPLGLVGMDESERIFFNSKHMTTRFITHLSKEYLKHKGWEHLHCFMNKYPESLPYDVYLGRNLY